MGHSAFPLEWPEGQKRRESWNRKASKFRDIGFGKCRDDLLRALKRFGARNVTLSTMIALRQDGLPYANMPQPSDPGVAVYFDIVKWNDAKRREVTTHYAIACDLYRKVSENLRALVHTLDAMSAIERHGSADMREQAMAGFASLPPAGTGEDWYRVLGCERGSPLDVVKARYREMTKSAHPDQGGSHDAMVRLNVAFAAAEREIGGRRG